MKVKNSFRLLVVLMSGFIAACGSSSEQTAVTGSIFAGPVNGASVTVKNTSGTTIARPVTTGSDGTYSIKILNTDLSSDLVFEANGGTFTDEATGTAGVAAGLFSAYITGGTLGTGSSVHVTPFTTIVQKVVTAGKTKTEAETAFNAAFGFIPDSALAPTDATNPATGATEEQKLAGFRVAVFSQLAKDLGESQSHLLAHLPEDLADDYILNGLPGHLAEDIGNKFETAFINFLANSNNHSGLTPDKIGTLPFAKTVLTTNYKVEYIPGMMSATQGKTAFKIRVSNISGGTAVSGATIALTPTMYMSTMSHGSPAGACTESATAGTYDCNMYYLMAGGSGMGYWKLQVGVNGENAVFYPAVGMAMGTDTVSATLRLSTDTYPGMMGASVRPYYVFKDALTAGMGGTYTFNVFIGARETMMSHPALYTGLSMNLGAFTATSVAVSISTDGGATWVPMIEDATYHGRFSVAGLTGFSSGVAGTIYVKLTINGNDYVDNATGDATAVGAHTYATFTVTPGAMGM